ncbi:MAG TPA: enoyl-CoA hydratase-related protein [Acidobacteriota bacterium]|nr:enoyl-CoA hydratase-related protein [Acidobacteriota bacterium]
MDQYNNLSIQIEDGIALLTISRPKAHNALNEATLDELEGAMNRLGEDAQVSCIIITGAGERAFVAGADIKELAGLDGPSGRRQSRRGQRLFSTIENLSKPVIAAVNGFCLGGGCELAMACHLRLAAPSARFGQPEVKLGLIPGYGGTQRLTRLVGQGRALELVLTGEMIPAPQAEAWGLVNRVVGEDADLLEECRKLASQIISNAPLAVEYGLEAVRKGADMPLEEALHYEAALFGLSCASEDMKEGTQAFVEKRKAQFKGR